MMVLSRVAETRRLIYCLLAAMSLLSFGCTSSPIMLDRVIVKNATKSKVSAVSVLHVPTQKIGEVNVILPNMTLDVGIYRQPMLARSAVLSWQDGQGRLWQVTLDLPRSDAVAGGDKTLVYVIRPIGDATVELYDSLMLK